MAGMTPPGSGTPAPGTRSLASAPCRRIRRAQAGGNSGKGRGVTESHRSPVDASADARLVQYSSRVRERRLRIPAASGSLTRPELDGVTTAMVVDGSLTSVNKVSE